MVEEGQTFVRVGIASACYVKYCTRLYGTGRKAAVEVLLWYCKRFAGLGVGRIPLGRVISGFPSNAQRLFIGASRLGQDPIGQQ